MSDQAHIRLPVGVRDFLPRAAARRRAIAEALLAEFERWGYDRIITPAFEYADVLARGLGADARAAAIRFVEPATGDVVALRPDITPQIARVVATRLGEVKGPIRLCYEGSVLRLTQGARGQRELIQAGVELIGAPIPEGDGEVISLARAALAAASLAETTIDVGHSALARAALGGIADPALAVDLREAIARKDADAAGRLAAAGRLPPRRRRLLAGLSELHGAPADVLRRARALPLDRIARGALDELERVLELVSDHGHAGRFTVDLGEVRGFEYYTGVRFAGYVPGVGDAVLLGGRYDDLIARYGRPARATGFAIDVEAIAQAERAQGVPAPEGLPGVVIVDRGPVRERALRVAAALRATGARAALDLEMRADDGERAAYAASVGARAVLVLDGRRARVLDPKGEARTVPAELLGQAVAGDGAPLARALGLAGADQPPAAPRAGQAHARRRRWR